MKTNQDTEKVIRDLRRDLHEAEDTVDLRHRDVARLHREAEALRMNVARLESTIWVDHEKNTEIELLTQERAEADAKCVRLSAHIDGLQDELKWAEEYYRKADRNAAWWNAEAITLKLELDDLAKHHAKDQEGRK